MKKLILITLSLVLISFANSVFAQGIVFMNKEMNKTEYNLMKSNIIAKIDIYQKITFQELKQWINIVNREIPLCKIKLMEIWLKNINSSNFVKKLNQELSKCDK